MSAQLPTLREAYVSDFLHQVKRVADSLRDVADDLESIGRRIERPDAHAGTIAADLVKTLDWGLANGSLSAVVRAAAEYDRIDREDKDKS